MEELIQSMKKALANTFAFYLKAHGFHWNIEGSNFPQYHSLFGTIYSEVQGSIDDFAEEIRKLGAYSPASFSRFSELSDIEDQIEILRPESMLNKLLTDSKLVLDSLEVAYEYAEANHEHATSNFLAERMGAHKKHEWQLRSTLKQF